MARQSPTELVTMLKGGGCIMLKGGGVYHAEGGGGACTMLKGGGLYHAEGGGVGGRGEGPSSDVATS